MTGGSEPLVGAERRSSRQGCLADSVLLHGGPGHGSRHVGMHEMRDTAQVVMYDHRGNGRSDRRGPAEWTLDTWVCAVPMSAAEEIAAALPHELVTSERFGHSGHGVSRDGPERAMQVRRDFVSAT